MPRIMVYNVYMTYCIIPTRHKIGKSSCAAVTRKIKLVIRIVISAGVFFTDFTCQNADKYLCYTYSQNIMVLI